MEAGRFVLGRRSNEHDEVWLGAPVWSREGGAAGVEWVGRTTSSDGRRFIWVAVRLTVGNVFPVSVAGS